LGPMEHHRGAHHRLLQGDAGGSFLHAPALEPALDARGAAVGAPLACHPDQSDHHRFLLARLDTDSGRLGIVPAAPAHPARKFAPPAVTPYLNRQEVGAAPVPTCWE